MGYFDFLELAVSHVEHIGLLKPGTVESFVMFPLDKAPVLRTGCEEADEVRLARLQGKDVDI